MCIPLGGVPEEEALPLLRQRLPDAGEEELKRALIVFGGVIGQVLHGMEEGTFRRVLELAPALAAAVAAPDEIELLRLTAGLDKDKEALDGVLGALRWIFRDALAARCGAASRLSTSPETADKLARAPHPGAAHGPAGNGGGAGAGPPAQHERHPVCHPVLRPPAGRGRAVNFSINDRKTSEWL